MAFNQSKKGTLSGTTMYSYLFKLHFIKFFKEFIIKEIRRNIIKWNKYC